MTNVIKHLSDSQLAQAIDYHKEKWLSLCAERRRRNEQSRINTILNCPECRNNGLCDKHKF